MDNSNLTNETNETKVDLFDFDIPELVPSKFEFDPDTLYDELYNILEHIARCAFYLGGNDEMGFLRKFMEENNAETVYKRYVKHLCDFVERYNNAIETSGLNNPRLIIIVDEEKTALLKNKNNYAICCVMTVSDDETETANE